MRLSTFIQQHMEALLQEWEKSAVAISPELKGADRQALRDHAGEMLEFIAWDIEQPRSASETAAKSKGQGKLPEQPTIAESHGIVRMEQGLSLNQLLLEHRALRASVTIRWGSQQNGLQTDDIAQLIRFNEAMDQLLNDAITGYSDRKEQETRLFETALSFSPDPSVIFSPSGQIIYLNTAMAELLDVSLETAKGKDLYTLGAPFAADLYESLGQTVSTGEVNRKEVTFRTFAGKDMTLDCLLAPVRDRDGRVEAVAKTSRDITERKASEYQAWRNANFDALTGIPNRRLFLDRLAQPLKESQRKTGGFTLMFIDLDHFKEANDQLGHSMGDLLLIEAAERLCACVRKMDTVARLGGDEFTIILKDLQQQEKIEAIAHKVLDQLNRPFQVREHRVQLSASIGVTRFPGDGSNVDQLMRNADQAMYAAKQQGGNRYRFYDPTLRALESEHSALSKELQLALDQQQLVVFYQPIFDLTSGAIYQAEAFLRWNHPQKGLLRPVTFINIAEQMGLMGAIDAFVLDQAVAHSRQWRAPGGAAFPISINESPTAFFSRAQVADWRAGLEQADLTGSRITVELTESALANACASSPDLIRSLRTKGLDLAIDNFGLARFSIAALQDCAVSCLKINQALVHNLNGDGQDNRVAAAIICMAHAMGLKVIAEGVETEAQRRHLAAAGCDYAQGNLFCEPLPAEQFQALLESGAASAG